MLKILFLVSLALLAASHIQSVKSSSSGGSDAGVQKPCARLFHPETGEQLELPSLPEKKKQLLGGAAAGNEGAFSFSSFTVMDGCLLSLWVAGSQEWGLESRSFPSGAYLNQLPGAGVSLTSYQCTCDQEKNQVTADYKDFKNRHIAGKNENGSNEFCTREIHNRNINLNGKCKPKNTFIFADEDDVKEVCNEKLVQIGHKRLYKSNEKFKIVDCVNKRHSPPKCIYIAKNKNRFRYIIIGCVNKLPVHFEGSSTRPPVFGINERV
ncbi:hypothetical protein AOXY_G38696 [Acipenser oxyrinchus oxyrinchus]|uniref:Ribonuclease A-domain domain-containing protein n=1 Tax=Acipenser oxyrinchus oxyrinchus TaxID=40147 RepID=A0AAD8FQT2_ACIOX|nr:hypothetical protein AOXY_G38696 [Acipenser oxyrinchus oxyrinchus]